MEIVWFIVGFLFETIGDHQMKKFKSSPENMEKVTTLGLWKYTRHPYYS
jgi:steroid 5-alpha reductase family enzyme